MTSPVAFLLRLNLYKQLTSANQQIKHEKIPWRKISPGELETLAILADDSLGPELLKRIKKTKREGLLTNTTPLKDAKKELKRRP